LLDSGVVRVRGIVFQEDGKAVLPVSNARLDSIGAVFAQYPAFKIEIGGPTDVKGDAAVKERLSLDQARAIYDYLKLKYPVLPAQNFTFRGYAGETVPGPRTRRVEFRVLNPDLLAPERAKRGLGQ
jgi:outer membrane protein OmpA-like peptidoglycan-associated protein